VKVAITGTPGTGKTTLAKALARALDVPYVGAGDIARSVDPNTAATGAMAEEGGFQRAMVKALHGLDDFVLDGFPRTRWQVDLLPHVTITILLTCREEIARERLLVRSRHENRRDGMRDLIDARIEEQTRLLELDLPNGWAWRLVGFERAVATSQKKPQQVLDGVLAYLRGEKKECF